MSKGRYVGATMTVSTLDSISRPCGTRIWKPVSAVTGADVSPQTNKRYQGSPGLTQRSSPKTSHTTPSSNGVKPS